MESSIRFLGHAGFAVRHGNVRVLIDPWFYPAFLASWFPYPDNRFLLPEILGGRFDYLYVSHAHEDHFDERFLRGLDRSCVVILPRFRSGALIDRFRRLGFETIVALDHKQTYELARDFVATMYLDTSHKEDSGLLLDMEGFRFLDLNDCNTPLSELPTRIDLVAAQFSGAMWYPDCYDYPPHVMAKKVADVRHGLLDTLRRKIELTEAKAYIPCAGPGCFLDPALDRYNNPKETIFPHWEHVAADFEAACPDVEILRLGPGGEIRPEAGRLVVTAAMTQAIAEDLGRYRERRHDEWAAFHAGAEPVITTQEVARYFAGLQRRNWHLLKGYAKDILVVCAGQAWRVRLGEPTEACVTEATEPFSRGYQFDMPPRVLRAILDHRVGWEEALLSLRIGLHRDPDVFDLTLMSLLRYGNEPAQTLALVREQKSCRETIERDGLRIQRFCPHAGEDLAHAIIENGIVECPRHHWRWDLRSGDCIAGGSVRLRVEASSVTPRKNIPSAAETRAPAGTP